MIRRALPLWLAAQCHSHLSLIGVLVGLVFVCILHSIGKPLTLCVRGWAEGCGYVRGLSFILCAMNQVFQRSCFFNFFLFRL